MITVPTFDNFIYVEKIEAMLITHSLVTTRIGARVEGGSVVAVDNISTSTSSLRQVSHSLYLYVHCPLTISIELQMSLGKLPLQEGKLIHAARGNFP